MSNDDYMDNILMILQMVILPDNDARCNVDVVVDANNNLNFSFLKTVEKGGELYIRRSSVDALSPVVRQMFYYYRNPITITAAQHKSTKS